MAQTVSLFKARIPARSDWTNQELAEFYRVEAALTQAGLKIFSDRGQSDEGDPWFVFCRAPDGDVVIHFARHGHEYIIASETFPEVLRGHDFRTLINSFAGQHPSLMALPPSPSRNRLFLHPSALLAAIVATAFFWIQPQDAVASELDGDAVGEPHALAAAAAQDSALTVDVALPHDRRLEGGEEHAQSRHMMLMLSIMSMAATFDWVSDHAILKLVDDWLVNEVPVEQRSAASTLDSTLAITDLGDESGTGADILRAAFDRSALRLDGANDDAYVQSAEMPAVVAHDDVLARAIESTFITVTDTVLDKGSSSRDDGRLAMVEPDLQGTMMVPAGAPTQGETGERSNRTELSSNHGDDHVQEPTSHALSFVLHEAEALKLDLSIKALDAQQDLIIYSGQGLRDLVQRVTAVLDGGHGGPELVIRDIAKPIEVETPTVDQDIPVVVERSQSDIVASLERFDSRMEPLVQAFLKNSPTVELVMVDGNVVLLETNQTRYAEDGFGVMSWALDDGSTLSLIGVLTDLPSLA